MANTGLSLPEVDCTCPVCCDIFREPVVLLCGHSFCKDCLLEWWRQSVSRKCPVCKETFPMRQQPPRNLALKSLSETLRQEKSQNAPGPREFCKQHNEKLKLFCLDDQQPMCVVCRDAKQHKKHNFEPIDEAEQRHKAKLKVALMHLKTKRGIFNKVKLNCDKMASHIKTQAKQTEKQIKEEFQKFYQFLRAEEAARIDLLRKEEAHKGQMMNIKIVNLTAEISTLPDTIKATEEDLKAKDILFMLNFKSTMDRARCTLPDPETPSGALIDVAKHLGNLRYKVWGRMKEIIQYTPVILDPNTAFSSLNVSKDLTSTTDGGRAQRVPDNPERRYNEVIGSEGISSGKHTWDVEMDFIHGYRFIGVTTVTEPNKPATDWTVFIDGPAHFQKIRVELDYDRGKLSFDYLNPERHIKTITHTFTELVFPVFERNTKILPVEISLIKRQTKYAC